MLHRIFIAINFPENIKAELLNLQKRWPTLPCHWIGKENMHLTLAFLGNVSDEELNVIFNIAKEIVEKNKQFSINFIKSAYGPGTRPPPRLVWIEGKKSRELSKLKEDLDALLSQKINFQPEKREFLPHITLGRINTWNWKRIEPEERPDVEVETSLEIPVKSIEIMESHLKKTGAEYTILMSAKLTSENS